MSNQIYLFRGNREPEKNLESLEKNRRFRRGLTNLQVAGLKVRAGAKDDSDGGDTTYLMDRMRSVADDLPLFVFTDPGDNIDESVVTAHPRNWGLRFSDLVLDTAAAYDGLHEIGSKSEKLKSLSLDYLWIRAILLYQYAGDQTSVSRLGRMRGNPLEALDKGDTITRVAHMMSLQDGAREAKNLADGVLASDKLLGLLAQAAAISVKSREEKDYEFWGFAVSMAQLAFKGYLENDDIPNAVLSGLVTTALYGDYLRLSTVTEIELPGIIQIYDEMMSHRTR